MAALAALAIACGLITTMSGCAAPADRTEAAQPVMLARAPSRVVSNGAQGGREHDQAVRDAAERELGPDVAATLPEVAPERGAAVAEPVDPGAELIVRAIANRLSQRPVNERGVTVIDLCAVRNHSRAGQSEFAEFRQRLASLLDAAGREDKIEFIANGKRDAKGEGGSEGAAGTEGSHYRMQGAAYLITADGFDQWELFLSLTPADRDFTVWDARSAIRVLRTPRPGQPQITYIGKPR
jgi:hypothetical protein